MHIRTEWQMAHKFGAEIIHPMHNLNPKIVGQIDFFLPNAMFCYGAIQILRDTIREGGRQNVT